MDQLEFFDIPSPCIGVCQAGKGGYCVGCFRSREERLYWHQASSYAKRTIVKACNRRKKRAKAVGFDKIDDQSEVPVQVTLFEDDLP